MDTFVEWLGGTGWFWVVLFWVAVVVTGRAAVRLLVDWKGMVTTRRFVEAAYASLDTLPDEAALEHDPRAPTFVHLVPAWEEPAIATTLRALLDARYPHGKLHVVVVTKEAEERAPHPLMGAPTAELVRRLRAELPPWQQKQLALLTMPGDGRKAHQLNWALRPEFLESLLDGQADPARVWVGVSDADSVLDRNTHRWIASDLLREANLLREADLREADLREADLGEADPREAEASAYQGVTLSLANVHRLGTRGRVCAIQQSSIFIRVTIARLINERRRVAWFARLRARAPRLARLARPLFELCLRRSQICLGHHEFVRLDTLRSVGLFPVSGATEDSTLGYALGARGILIRPLPLLELVDLPETTEGIVRQNARWYKGVLDDARFLWETWRLRRSAFNLAQLCRHVGSKVVEWPTAAVVYPGFGFLAWHLGHRFAAHPVWFALGVVLPLLSLGLTVWVGGVLTQHLIERLTPYCPRPVDLARTTVRAKLWETFRCQTYWLLATRGAWRVLWALARRGHYHSAKTDRVTSGRRRRLR